MSREIRWFVAEDVLGLVGDRAVGEAEVRHGFQAWEDVACSDVTMPFGGVKAGGRAGFFEGRENENIVVAVRSGWTYDPSAIAVTTSAFDSRTGVVVDADIELNVAEFRFVKADAGCRMQSGEMDLRNTITHEVGHVLGLDHPPNIARYREATMFASAPPCETSKRTLAQDDVDGLCFVYPVGMQSQQCFPPDGPSFALVESDDGFGGCRAVRANGGKGGRGAEGVLFFGLSFLVALRRFVLGAGMVSSRTPLPRSRRSSSGSGRKAGRRSSSCSR